MENFQHGLPAQEGVRHGDGAQGAPLGSHTRCDLSYEKLRLRSVGAGSVVSIVVHRNQQAGWKISFFLRPLRDGNPMCASGEDTNVRDANVELYASLESPDFIKRKEIRL